ncbi:MAG: hypothetical protein LBD74_05000 [Spirochaetaceae bacterium]|jgi:hypothetical protein|nr:hypothetical protein [Spirochaetaceae bacterium]
MRDVWKKALSLLVVGLAGLLFSTRVGAEDKRTSPGDTRSIPLELFLIIDGSAALSSVQDEVVRWLHEQVVDRILREGDTFTVWLAREKGEAIFSERLRGVGDKARIKRVLQALPLQEGSVNFAVPIREATARSQRSSALTYTLLISGYASGPTPSLGGDAVGLLRFTRVEEFSGWRATVVGLGINSRVRQAAAAYMQYHP